MQKSEKYKVVISVGSSKIEEIEPEIPVPISFVWHSNRVQSAVKYIELSWGSFRS